MALDRQVFSGVYRAKVVNNRDPQKQRRLQVEISTAVGESTEWVWPMEPASMSTEVPGIGQGVWVQFQAGDHEYPVWFGSFGKHQGQSKKIHVKPLLNSIDISTLTSYVKTISQTDGTTEVDLTATIIAMANSLKDHETRISSLESQVATLKSTLATRSAPEHTHGSNG